MVIKTTAVDNKFVLRMNKYYILSKNTSGFKMFSGSLLI